MTKISKQMKKWMGDFGNAYTDRNALSLKEVDALYRRNFGTTKTELNNFFLGDLKRSIRILEVGSNIGNQLLYLQKMGFKHLYGIEINNYALEFSKSLTKNINLIRGSAFDIPFKSGYFDIVFTSDVLIHIAPSDIKKVLKEIYRCAKKYIWGFEYYADEYTEVLYRGNKDLLWKANFPEIYIKFFPDLIIAKQKFLKYKNNNNVDIMFLLKKKR